MGQLNTKNETMTPAAGKMKNLKPKLRGDLVAAKSDGRAKHVSGPAKHNEGDVTPYPGATQFIRPMFSPIYP